jgi:hypothetical protein
LIHTCLLFRFWGFSFLHRKCCVKSSNPKNESLFYVQCSAPVNVLHQNRQNKISPVKNTSEGENQKYLQLFILQNMGFFFLKPCKSTTMKMRMFVKHTPIISQASTQHIYSFLLHKMITYVASNPNYVPSSPNYELSMGNYASSRHNYVSSMGNYVSSMSNYASSMPNYMSSISNYASSIPNYTSSSHNYAI